MELGNAPRQKQAYTIVGSGNWASKPQWLQSYTQPDLKSSMEQELSTEADEIDFMEPAGTAGLPEGVIAAFRVVRDALYPTCTRRHADSQELEKLHEL